MAHNPSDTPPTKRSATSVVVGLALALFGVGLLAVAVIFVLSAAGRTPGLWLYLTAMAAPIGLLLAIVFIVVSGSRAHRPKRPNRTGSGV